MTPDAPLLRTVARHLGVDGPPDADLLARIVAGDGGAFALLVSRHGPTVLGVCRRVLGPGPDADDAFQATFVVLHRRAGRLQRPEQVGAWLYGVAHRTARTARTRRVRRLRREAPTHPLPEVPTRPDAPADVGSAVERELGKLPERFRAAVALCLLDGRSRAEAAKLLGLPEGTLSSRLAEGRKRLAARLRRAGLGAVVAAPAAVPGPVTAAAVRAAAGGVVPSLASEVLTAMTRATQLKWAAGLVAAALATTGVAGLAGGPKPAPAPAPVAAEADDEGANKKLEDAPAVVVRTVPEAGTLVGADVAEVSVTYSKPMTDNSWSWSTNTSFGLFPAVDEGRKLRYDAKTRTFTLPVKLQPGKTYALQLNSERFGNFRDAGGKPAQPYLLVFATKGK